MWKRLLLYVTKISLYHIVKIVVVFNETKTLGLYFGLSRLRSLPDLEFDENVLVRSEISNKLCI